MPRTLGVAIPYHYRCRSRASRVSRARATTL